MITLTSAEADGIRYGEGGAGASYSDEDPAIYRYRLWRTWDAEEPIALFVMLNPSTATHLELDATLRRCRKFAMDWKMGGFEVVNLFAYRATEPVDMMGAHDPVGPENDVLFERAEAIWSSGGIVIAGWGPTGAFRDRCYAVKDRLARASVPLHYLKLTKQGFPGHPLYLPAESLPARLT